MEVAGGLRNPARTCYTEEGDERSSKNREEVNQTLDRGEGRRPDARSSARRGGRRSATDLRQTPELGAAGLVSAVTGER